jgi:GNAT superfamily N-acetyltransferase
MELPAADATVRDATAVDAEAIGVVQAAAWRVSYRELLPAGTLAALDPAQIAEVWRDAIVRPPSGAHRVLVAVAAGRVVGFAAIAPAGEGGAGDGGPSVGELAALVVSPDAERTGHGSRLLNAAVDRLRQVGFGRAVVWVVESDAVRRRFLTSAGFADDGARRTFATGAADAPELRELRLAAALETDA